jgi:hypothetical protein
VNNAGDQEGSVLRTSNFCRMTVSKYHRFEADAIRKYKQMFEFTNLDNSRPQYSPEKREHAATIG